MSSTGGGGGAAATAAAGPGVAAAAAANPRKFSEKLALHRQRQAEEKAEFEQMMKELNEVKGMSNHQMRVRLYQGITLHKGNTLTVGTYDHGIRCSWVQQASKEITAECIRMKYRQFSSQLQQLQVGLNTSSSSSYLATYVRRAPVGQHKLVILTHIHCFSPSSSSAIPFDSLCVNRVRLVFIFPCGYQWSTSADRRKSRKCVLVA